MNPSDPLHPLRRVCVYCGSSDGADPKYAHAARDLGLELARRGLGLVYGGARRGTMGVVADAVLGAGGEAHGVIPHGLVALEVAHEGLTARDDVETLHERKARMTELADAFVVLPGGHGTLDELFEALTWLQLAIHSKPVGVLNLDGYYDHLLAHLDRCRDEGFLRPEHRAMLQSAPTAAALLDALERAPLPERPTWRAVPRP